MAGIFEAILIKSNILINEKEGVMLKKKVVTFNVSTELCVKLELVSRLLNKSMSQIVDDLLRENLKTEAVIKQFQLAEANRKIEEAQIKLLLS